MQESTCRAGPRAPGRRLGVARRAGEHRRTPASCMVYTDSDDDLPRGLNTLLDVAFNLGYPRLVLALLRMGSCAYGDGLRVALTKQGTNEIDATVETLLDVVAADGAVAASAEAAEARERAPEATLRQIRADLCRALLFNYVQTGATGLDMDFDVGMSLCDTFLLPEACRTAVHVDDDKAREFLMANASSPERKSRLIDSITHTCHDS